jgi:hypothetical protein
MRTLDGKLWRSADEGKTWDQLEESKESRFIGMYQDPYTADRVSDRQCGFHRITLTNCPHFRLSLSLQIRSTI